jgi:hypothetical protein
VPAGDQAAAPAAPAPAYPAPGAELGDQVAAPVPAGDQAAPVVALAVEEGAAPAGHQAAAPAGPHRMYMPIIVIGERNE